MARLAAGEGKARVENEPIKVRDALAILEKDGRGLEAEVACLLVE